MDSPLELATSARVACAMLEGQLDRRAYKKAAATNRKLWDRINAMACRIEDLQAEVERLQTPAAVAVTVVEAEEPTVEISEEAPAPAATVTLGARPPGFDRVRSAMRKERVNPCALVPDEVERPIITRLVGRRRRIATNQPGEMRGVADHGHDETVWKSVEAAVESGRLEEGRDYTPTEIREAIGRNPGCMDGICLDLASYRSPIKMMDTGSGTYRFGRRFAERTF